MKEKELKCYVLTIRTDFMANHPRKGESTHFIQQILECRKIHTIRENYDYWKRIVDEVNAGNAYLSVRHWTGLPYRSPQKEIKKFYKLGSQRILVVNHGNFLYMNISDEKTDKPIVHSDCVDFGDIQSNIKLSELVAKNDGLTIEDFDAWFFPKNKQGKKKGIIIHFTDFRY